METRYLMQYLKQVLSVTNCDNAIHAQLRADLGNGEKGLSDGSRIRKASRLEKNVVKLN